MCHIAIDAVIIVHALNTADAADTAAAAAAADDDDDDDDDACLVV